MRKKRKSIKIQMITTIITTATALFGVVWGIGEIKLNEAEAAMRQKETVNLRIIGTTDLHGQLNSKDYEQGVDYNNGGLARVFDLIQTTRNELPKENTVTLDAGDTLFDYTTEYIFSENQYVLQPIYKAMAKVGYDAITLGNHDFDYGYEYIQRQLNETGLRDITIVSNVTDSKTGEYPFLENMLITRKMKTSSGKEIEVKVGIIGQTIPVLTSKTHSYTGILKTEDMIINAQIQATKLKEMGADIIIALSHTGIGPEEPELNFKNVAYALTKIPEIDVVVSGHEHNLFPTTDMSSPYYKLPNVDKKTYLMNGKNVIMAGSRGKAIGVIDLTLEVHDDFFEIAERTSEIRLVTADNTKEDKAIAQSYGDWEEKLLDYSTDVIAKMDNGALIQNYFGLLGDNAAIQLLNDAKIDYATRYVNTTGKSYKNYPIVAASTYASYGAGSVEDFINLHDIITESRLSAIQPYNNYIYIYTITGKQLKEWLEWTASAYETLSIDKKWIDGTMSGLMRQTGFKSLIREEWLNDWSNFYVFDGVDYVINPYGEPRYDLNGNRIDMNKRIRSVKYNGVPVDDKMVMLLVTNKITQPTDANSGVEKKVVLNGFIRTQAILSKYINQISSGDTVIPHIDYNWRVSLPQGSSFLMTAPNYAHAIIEAMPWYKEYLTESNKYRYYVASYPNENGDTIGPHIVTTPTITSATSSPFEVSINVTDASEIKELRYLSGDYDVNYTAWPIASSILNKTFTVWKNGTYTIYAEDSYHNKTVYKLVINNFDRNLLGLPSVNTYTNRKTVISGRAEPNTKIVFEAYTGRYESKVSGSGSYSYSLPSQPSGSAINVYVKDEARGLESARVIVSVKRTGPNQPSINPINNNAGYITGTTGDYDASVIAMIEDKVYVSKQGGKELYEKNTEIYDPSLDIVETLIEVNDAGYYIILLPPQVAWNTVTVYNIDHLSRNSRANKTKVLEVAPNAPVVYEVSNIERSLRGYVPILSNKIYEISITLAGETYLTETDKNGNFSFQFGEQLYAGQKIILTATDSKNGATRTSYPTEVIVNNIEDYVIADSTNLTLNNVMEMSDYISGTYLDKGSVYLAITNGDGENFQSMLYTADTDDFGEFNYWLDENLEAGAKIYVMARFIDGRILLANKTVVIPEKPDKPSLLKKVTNTDKKVQIIAKKDCKVTLSIGTKTYVSSIYQVDKATGQSIYSFTTDREVSGTEIKVIASNVTGTSNVLTSKIVKTAPDQPQVNAVKAGDKVITGKVELLNFTVPVLNGTTETEQIPDQFKKAPSNVAKTQTRVFALIGKKTYEGTIDKKGKYSIKIPVQKEGTKIKVWGMNKAGRGPLITVIVVK